MSDELSEWNERIDAVMAGYEDDPEGGHHAEDALLKDFVSAVATGRLPDPAVVAEALYDRLLTQDRTKWYA